MKSSREQFEEWLPSSFDNDVNPAAANKGADGEYFYTRTKKLWESWQASRQALANEEVTTAPFVKVSE